MRHINRIHGLGDHNVWDILCSGTFVHVYTSGISDGAGVLLSGKEILGRVQYIGNLTAFEGM